MHPEHTYTTYTKHYYIGSERISSKLGTRKDLGIMCEQLGLYPDLVDEMNRRVEEAGEQMNVLYSNLDKDLRLPTPHYYDSNFNLICFEPSHHPELYDAYWYHPDHLGSSSFITNTTGEISQHMEYLPFGETLVEEHLNSYNSPFKFNAKEYDAETGNYYYGARYMNPKWSMWLGVDPLAEKYPSISPFSYVANNPINAIDPDGRYIIFINGLRLGKANADQRRLLGGYKIHQTDVYNYWSTEQNTFGREVKIDAYYKRKYNDDNIGFTSGSSQWSSSAKQRMREGKQKAKLFHRMVKAGDIILDVGETIKVVSHSQGGAHAAGFAEKLMSYNDADGNALYNIEVLEYITPHQPTDIVHPNGPQGIQYSHPSDKVSSDSPWWMPNGGTEYGKIQGIDHFYGGDIMGGEGQPPINMSTRGGHNVTDNDKFIKRGE